MASNDSYQKISIWKETKDLLKPTKPTGKSCVAHKMFEKGLIETDSIAEAVNHMVCAYARMLKILD